MILSCPVCTNNFSISPWRLKRSKSVCCSKQCKIKHQTIRRYPLIAGKCGWCGGNIVVRNSSFDKKNRKFCSLSCRAKWGAKNIKQNWSNESRKILSEQAKRLFPKGRKFSIETRTRMRNANLGPKSHFWKGGLTDENRKLRNSLMHKEWRRLVYERDNYTCQECGVRSGKGQHVKLNADHIKPWSTYPELRFDITNGRTLCLDCHKKTDTFGFKAILNKR